MRLTETLPIRRSYASMEPADTTPSSRMSHGRLAPVKLFILLLLAGLQACAPAAFRPLRSVKESETAVIRPSQTHEIPTQYPSEIPVTDHPTKQTAGSESQSVAITILYDNNEHDPRLQTDWGFAALVETDGHRLLFDTGANGAILLKNMEVLGFEPRSIEGVVLSHIHGDHVGGLDTLLAAGAEPTVYLPPSFPEPFKERIRQQAEVTEVSAGMAILDEVFTTGQIEGSPPEQALVIRQEQGLVLITGCAHPGVAGMVRRAKQIFDEPSHLVMGGFHLHDRSARELADLLAEFRDLGVIKVAPCHCTGDRAIEAFRQEYQADFIEAGVGSEIRTGPSVPG
ncbi:MAG: MBL fold metallo-hydrolase [Anaerolineales bacterium]